ncbi:MAG: hypothetical protein WD993_08070 [Thermoleophilaceae bacterium]
MAETVIHHPNRDKAESKATKAIVVMLLLVSAGLVLVVTIGGWSALQGAQLLALAYAALNVVMAYHIANWRRGLLPVAAALAVLYGVLAAIAGPSWFARDKPGFSEPLLAPDLLGLLTLLIVPVQLLIVAFAARAFTQQWNVEIEVEADTERRGPKAPHRGGTTQPLGA